MPSIFETLSDEVLMIIFRYSDDIYTMFRTFLGLNQRINCILIDKRSNLFADFLYINTGDVTFTVYYNSDVFQTVSYQLLHMHSPIDEQQLRQCFQSLVNFHIKEQCMRLQDQVRSNLAAFNTMRQQLSDMEIVDVDNQLRSRFFDLPNNAITTKSIQQIESLILTKAAHLQCDNYQPNQLNFAKALNQFLLRHLNNIHSVRRPLIHSITHMLQTLIVSNTRLLMNRDRTEIEDSSSVWYFLFYSIYQLQYYYYTPPDISINMKCYNAVVHLLLFAIQCQIETNSDENWTRETLFDVLRMISAEEISNKNELFIQSVQWEILNIIIDQYSLISRMPWQEEQESIFRSILCDLIKRNRVDVILLLYYRLPQVQSYFNNSNNLDQNVNILIGSSTGRQLLKIFIDEKPCQSWLSSKALLFLLLQKKERHLLQKILRSSSLSLIHQVDADGNDPLLYISLKVRGCRHRIIEFLITMGCDLQRRNLNGENFLDAIQYRRNRTLLKDLLEKEIIQINDQSGAIEIIHKTQL